MPTLHTGRTTHDLVWTTAARVRGRRLRENVTSNRLRRAPSHGICSRSYGRAQPTSNATITYGDEMGNRPRTTGSAICEGVPRQFEHAGVHLLPFKRPTGSNNDADDSISSAQTRPTCSTYHEHDGDDNERNYRRMEPLGCTRLAASRCGRARVSRIIDEDGKAIGRYGRGPARGHQ
ncbi:hypothetical protein BJ912DRAFT_1009402 [Pholiota molesta]|nr:hypothetical protein BJ912DRAFT_1009402 [Pholiota molesta]